MHWQHPVTGRHARCQFMVDVGSRAPMVTVFEETRERSNRDNQTAECKESFLKDWFVHRGRPRLIRMDPDGCYMSNEMLNTSHHDLGFNTEVIPGEAPWKLSITGVIMRLVKRGTTNQQGRGDDPTKKGKRAQPRRGGRGDQKRKKEEVFFFQCFGIQKTKGLVGRHKRLY